MAQTGEADRLREERAAAEATYTAGDRVTDADGNRATFIRMGATYAAWLAGGAEAIVRYTGEQHESACLIAGMTKGWGGR